MSIWPVVVGLTWILAAESVQPAQGTNKVDLNGYLQAGYAALKADLMAAAEAMPEADYGFKPTTMSEVRTFGETILHVASGHFTTCARLRGVSDHPTESVDSASKAAVVKTLSASFAFCDGALPSTSDATSDEWVKQGPVEIPRTAALVGLIAHDAEMYGITTVYLRARNIVPPSTARQKNSR